MKEYIYKWIDSVDNVNRQEWQQIFPNEILKSIDLFKTMEISFNDSVKYHYLCIYDEEEIIAILPCFEYYLDFDVAASRKIQCLIKKLRYLCHGIMSTKVFVLGSYIATCEHYIGIGTKITDKGLLDIKKEILQQSKKLNCKVIMIKEIPKHQLSEIQSIFDEYTFVDSLPNSYVPLLTGLTPYPSGLTTKAKQRFKKAKKNFDDELLKFQITTDFSNLNSISYSLYENVLNKSHTVFDRLNEKFFSNIQYYFPQDTFLLTIHDTNNQIRAIELIFKDHDKLIPIYLGLDYSYKNVKCLYHNIIIHAIEMAEEMRCEYVVLGQNNYFPKALSGAIIERVFLGFYSSHIIYSFIIKHIFKLLFPVFINNVGFFYNNQSSRFISKFCRKFHIEIEYPINKL